MDRRSSTRQNDTVTKKNAAEGGSGGNAEAGRGDRARAKRGIGWRKRIAVVALARKLASDRIASFPINNM
jgi:hypothetical protein